MKIDLEELYKIIEKCGERFSYLSYENGRWDAVADRGEWREDLGTYCEAGCCGTFTADNPIEAVEALLKSCTK